MSRSPRLCFDGTTYPDGTAYWNQSDISWYDPNTPADAPGTDYITHDLPSSITLGGTVYSQVTVWGSGLVSFGPPTQQQVNFFSGTTPPSSASGFQGSYIALDNLGDSTDSLFVGTTNGDGLLNIPAALEISFAPTQNAGQNPPNSFPVIFSSNGITVGGNGQTSSSVIVVHLAGGGNLTTADNSLVNASGDGMLINIGNSDTVNVAGANETVSVFGKGSAVSVSGSGAFIMSNGLDDNINVSGISSTVWVGGKGSTVSVSGGGQYAVSDYVTFANGGVLNVTGNTNLVANGSGVTVNAKGLDSLTLYGANNTVTIGGAGSQVWAGGNGQNGSADVINFASGGVLNEVGGANLTVSGSGLTVYASVSDNLVLHGANDTVNIGGAGDVVYIGGNGQTAAVTDLVSGAQATSLSVHESDNSRVDVGISGVYATIGNADTLGIYGSAETVAASGAGDVVYIGGNGQTAAVTDLVSGAQATSLSVHESDGSRVDVDGGSALVTLGVNDTLGINGNNNTLAFARTTGSASVWGFNTTDHIQLSAGDFVSYSYLLGATRQSGADTIITIDANDQIVLKGVVASSLSSSQFSFV